MATREQFLAKLSSYVGTVEDPPESNCQPFSKALGRPCEQWCADFLGAGAKEVGLTLPSDSAYTPTMADAFRRAGRLFHDPVPGDLAFVDFPGDNTHGIQHVLAVKTVAATTIGTIEGNTSSGNVGSQDAGGGVFERTRPKLWIVGYGRPAFDADPATLGPGGHIVTDEEAEMGCVVDRPQGGYIVVAHDGAVFAYGTAPYLGGVNQHPEWKLGGNIVGGTWTPSGNGYWLVGHDGAVFSFGDAQYRGGFNAEPAATRGSRFAVGMATVGAGYEIVTFDPSNDGSPYDAYAYGA
jgi:hypothetical protein